MLTRDNHGCPNNTQARQAGVENHALRRQLAGARRELKSARRALTRSYAQVAELRAEQNADAAKVKQVCAENDRLKARIRDLGLALQTVSSIAQSAVSDS